MLSLIMSGKPLCYLLRTKGLRDIDVGESGLGKMFKRRWRYSKKRCVSIESLNLTQVMRQEHYCKNRLMIN